MSNEIQWTPLLPSLNLTSIMGVAVQDNDGGAAGVLDDSQPFKVKVTWTVPLPIVPLLGGSFRLRVFAESMGPGQEKQVGVDKVVVVAAGTSSYTAEVDVAAGSLEGEGFGSPAVSGVYKIIAVLQHLNPIPNTVSGYAEGPLIQIRRP